MTLLPKVSAAWLPWQGRTWKRHCFGHVNGPYVTSAVVVVDGGVVVSAVAVVVGVVLVVVTPQSLKVAGHVPVPASANGRQIPAAFWQTPWPPNTQPEHAVPILPVVVLATGVVVVIRQSSVLAGHTPLLPGA